MDTKYFLASKINLFAILTILLGGLTYASKLELTPQTLGMITGAIGLVNFVLRTYFTSTPLTTSTTSSFNG